MCLQESLFPNVLKNNEIIFNTLLIYSRWFTAEAWYKCIDFCMCVSN